MSAITLDPPSSARRRAFTPEDRIFVSIGLYGALTLAIAVPLALMFLWSIADCLLYTSPSPRDS